VFDRPGLDAALACLASASLWTVVAIDYELGYLLAPKSSPAGWQAGERPLARFWRFRRRVDLSADEAHTWLAQQAAGQVAGIGGVRSAIDEKDYLFAVDRIKTLISAGDCYQVNFTFPLEFTCYGSPLDLYVRLRARQPVRYGGFVGDTRQGIVSLSPELFIERSGDHLTTRPMKGTAPRSLAPAVLAESKKDRAENLMIVDLLRNDLGRVGETGSVEVGRLFEIEDYPTVWQMVSEVSARVPGRSFGELLQALFPCGSITGAPKIRAMQIIGELEGQARGLYTGAFGYLAPNGDFRLNVPIRTLEIAPDGQGRMGIGSGVVADSRGPAEWQECLAKARFLTQADPGIQLIETLRREDGNYPRLAGHLARLRHSAAWLGFALDDAAVLAALATQPEVGLWRVRLALAHDGTFVVQAFPLSDEAGTHRLARLADTPIDSRHPLRGHKSTDRAIYDAALQSIADDPVIFDVVFLNERGEVAEGARSNVFVERDGILLTPPLCSGALPGVLRAELINNGRAREAILRSTDLQGGFFLGNALRGLIPARLVD
jgi:para-aminobenzoate synthetase/4-amino-4-deoxychorismate lyase